MPFPLYIFSLRNVTTDIEMNDSIGVVRKRLRNVNTVANEIVRTPKKNAVKRKQKDQFCSNWF